MKHPREMGSQSVRLYPFGLKLEGFFIGDKRSK